jgi:hypothetical protein
VANRNPQTAAKRQRELAKQERRERKAEKKAAAAAEKKRQKDGVIEPAPSTEEAISHWERV